MSVAVAAERLVDPYGRPLVRADKVYTADEIERAFAMQSRRAGRVTKPLEQSAWVYSCWSQIVSQFAQIPDRMWTRSQSYNEVLRHDVLDLMQEPNSRQSWFAWKEEWAGHLVGGGNVWIYKDGVQMNGLPRRLLLFGINSVRPVRIGYGGPAKAWEVMNAAGEWDEVPLQRMIHTKLPNPYDPALGLAPTTSLLLSLNADYARQVYDEVFFRRNAAPIGILRNKDIQHLDEEQRKMLREEWGHVYGGADNAGGTAFLGGGWEYQALFHQHVQAQFGDVRKITRSEIGAAFWGFPVSMMNSEENGGLGKAEQEASRLRLVENCVLPHCARYAADLNRFLVRPYDPRVALLPDTDSIPVLITTQLKAKFDILKAGAVSGFPINILRELLDLPVNAIPGGDSGYLPGNYVPIELLGGTEPAADGEVEDEDTGAEESEDDDADASAPQAQAFRALELPDPLVLRTAAKFKAALWRLRTAAYRRELPGALGAMRVEWAKTFLPLVAAAYQHGWEELRRDRFGGGPVWLDQVGDPEAELVRLQTDVRQLRFRSDRMARECELHAKRIVRVLGSIAEDMTQIAEQERIPKALSGLQKASRRAAQHVVRAAVNAGRYEAALTAEPCLVRHKNCQLDHRSGIYPGRPDGSGRLDVCGCAVDALADGRRRRIADGTHQVARGDRRHLPADGQEARLPGGVSFPC